ITATLALLTATFAPAFPLSFEVRRCTITVRRGFTRLGGGLQGCRVIDGILFGTALPDFARRAVAHRAASWDTTVFAGFFLGLGRWNGRRIGNIRSSRN